MITALKFLHIAALCIWCAGLVALPLLLAKHDVGDAQLEYARLRVLTHTAFIAIITPAAVLAIGLGTALLFLRGVFVPWMFAKLVLVGVLVLVHARIGHVTIRMGEEGDYVPPVAWRLVLLSGTAMVAVLVLVLGKPNLSDGLAPAWLLAPQDQPLPVDEVPR